MGAAATDHVFLDGGHTIDFTNKAFEVLDHLGWEHAGAVLPTLAQQTAGASRAEESAAWRHPHDLAGLLARAAAALPARLDAPGPRTFAGDDDVDSLAWVILGDDSARSWPPSTGPWPPVPPWRSWPGRWPTPPPCG